MLFLQMGDTPLHVVSGSFLYQNNDKVVEALIKGGADVNITNKVRINNMHMKKRGIL